jgi:hypothetical protein
MEAIGSYASSEDEDVPASIGQSGTDATEKNKRKLPAPDFGDLNASQTFFKKRCNAGSNGSEEHDSRSDGSKRWVRSFAHVDGHWPSHVYLVGEHFVHDSMARIFTLRCLSVPIDSRIEWMTSCAMTVGKSVLSTENCSVQETHDTHATEEKAKLSEPEIIPLMEDEGAELHISLTRTFVLKYDQIVPFVEDLKQVTKVTCLLK